MEIDTFLFFFASAVHPFGLQGRRIAAASAVHPLGLQGRRIAAAPVTDNTVSVAAIASGTVFSLKKK